jgi:uncharacterized membrane protein (DUF485 family)
MLHEPAAQSGPDLSIAYKMRVGVWMFLIYAIFYGGFVALNVLKPVLMETPFCFGMNLAVVYGFSLILFALVLALIYTAMCSRKEAELNPKKVEGATK